MSEENKEKNKEEVTDKDLLQDKFDIMVIRYLKRMRERKVLSQEETRAMDDIENRIQNGKAVSQEEMNLFYKIASQNDMMSGKEIDILRQKAEAYYEENMSIQSERISTAESREKLSFMEQTIMKDLDLAVQMGDMEKIDKFTEELNKIKGTRDSLEEPQKPEDLNREEKLDAKGEEEVYKSLDEYAEMRQQELNEHNVSEAIHHSDEIIQPFSIEDIKETTENEKLNDFNKEIEDVKTIDDERELDANEK